MHKRRFLHQGMSLFLMVNSLNCSQSVQTTKQTIVSKNKYVLYFLDSQRKATILQDKLITRETYFVAKKAIDEAPASLQNIGVVDLRCKNGSIIQSFPELGWLNIVHQDGTVEKIYVDNKKFPIAARQVLSTDGFRKVFLRNGTYSTKMPNDSRWINSDSLRKGLYDSKLNLNLKIIRSLVNY